LLDVLDGPQPNQAKIYPSSGHGVEGAVIEREKTAPKYRHLTGNRITLPPSGLALSLDTPSKTAFEAESKPNRD
jgi:hypothetical protein